MNNTFLKHVFLVHFAALLILVNYSPASGQLSSLPSQPWPENPVTVSFAPDLVEIGRYRNELFQHLNGQLGYPDWELEILRAFQTWARHSNVTFAITADSPRAFGIPGLAQGDPRFGDIRLGAFPQANVLGNAVPYHPSAGVWAGDIFLDTNRTFVIDDGGSGHPAADQYDLYSVLLHEIGNSLGLLDEELDPESVMFFAYIGTRRDLSAMDVANIQKRYGARSADPWERVSTNDDFTTATPIAYATQFLQSLVEVRNGRIQERSDVDFYRFQGNASGENCWVKLRAKGTSLLCGRITVFDEDFNELATICAKDPRDNSVGTAITGIRPGEDIYVAIDWSGVPDFDFGDYQLALDFNENAGEEFALGEKSGDDDDDDDDDDDEKRFGEFFEAGDEALVDLLYSRQGLIDGETDANHSLANAVELITPVGVVAGSRFELISALATPTDIDVYRIRTAANATGTMAIDLTPLGIDPASIEVMLLNSAQQAIPVNRRFLASGDVVVEADGIQSDAIYYLRVQSRVGNTLAGNYLLLVNVATKTSNLQQIQQVSLSASVPDRFGEFTAYKTQLFRFDLSMTSPDSTNQACQFTVYNDAGRVELVTSVRSAGKHIAYVWLQAGIHHFRFTARTRNNQGVRAAVVTLQGASISDDEGPVLLDPSGNPISGPQQPGTNPTPPPTWQFPRFLIGLLIPPEKPW